MLIRAAQSDGTVIVSFRIGNVAATGPVSVVGTFNDWSPDVHPFVPLVADPASMQADVVCAVGEVHRFRYLGADGCWFDDDAADGYVDNGLGGRDGLVRFDALGPAAASPTADPALLPMVELDADATVVLPNVATAPAAQPALAAAEAALAATQPALAAT